jgi:hypothetical protein
MPPGFCCAAAGRERKSSSRLRILPTLPGGKFFVKMRTFPFAFIGRWSISNLSRCYEGTARPSAASAAPPNSQADRNPETRALSRLPAGGLKDEPRVAPARMLCLPPVQNQFDKQFTPDLSLSVQVGSLRASRQWRCRRARVAITPFSASRAVTAVKEKPVYQNAGGIHGSAEKPGPGSVEEVSQDAQ